MKKPIQDMGGHVACTKPFRLLRYEANRRPDPGECVDCLVIVNDRTDGRPRARLELSDGASWQPIAYLDEAAEAATELVPVPLVPKPQVEIIQPSPQRIQIRPPKPDLADRMMQDAETAAKIESVQHEVAETMRAATSLAQRAIDHERRLVHLEGQLNRLIGEARQKINAA